MKFPTKMYAQAGYFQPREVIVPADQPETTLWQTIGANMQQPSMYDMGMFTAAQNAQQNVMPVQTQGLEVPYIQPTQQEIDAMKTADIPLQNVPVTPDQEISLSENQLTTGVPLTSQSLFATAYPNAAQPMFTQPVQGMHPQTAEDIIFGKYAQPTFEQQFPSPKKEGIPGLTFNVGKTIREFDKDTDKTVGAQIQQAYEDEQTTLDPGILKKPDVKHVNTSPYDVYPDTDNPYITEYEQKMEDIGDKYFFGQRMYGASALLHNILQNEPPSKFSKMVNLDKFDLDEKPYMAAAAQQQEQEALRNRAAREMSGQLSDQLKFDSVRGVQSQRQRMGLATAYSQALQQVNNMNTQVAQKQEMINAQKSDQDQQFNLQQKMAHHLRKGEAISKALGMLSQTEGHEARFKADTAYAVSQHKIMHDHKQKQDRMNRAALLLQHSKGFRDSEQYQSGLREKKAAFMSSIDKQIRDEKLIPYTGDISKLEDDIAAKEALLAGYEKESQMSLPDEAGDMPTISDEDAKDPVKMQAHNDLMEEWRAKDQEFKRVSATIKNAKSAYASLAPRVDKLRSDYLLKKKGQERMNELWDASSIRAEFDKEFKQQYGYVDLQDLSTELPALANIYKRKI